jgi:hypothetical protein
MASLLTWLFESPEGTTLLSASPVILAGLIYAAWQLFEEWVA